MCDISVLEYERERMSQLEHRLKEKETVIQDMTELQRELTDTIDDLNDKLRRLQIETKGGLRKHEQISPDFLALQRQHEQTKLENARMQEDLSRLEAQLSLRSRDSHLVRKLQGLIIDVCQVDKPPCHRKVWRWVRKLIEDYAKLKRAK